MIEATQVGQYLQVRRLPDMERGKTCKWAVLSSSGDVLGRIDWYSPWRCYVLTSNPAAIFNADCLRDLADFLDGNREKRATPTPTGEEADDG